MNDEKNEKLMRAMGEIDEDLIEEALEVRRPRNRWVRWSALAACLAFLMICTPILLPLLRVVGAGGAKEEFDEDYCYSAEVGEDNRLETIQSMSDKSENADWFGELLDQLENANSKVEEPDMELSDGKKEEDPSGKEDERFAAVEDKSDSTDTVRLGVATAETVKLYFKKSDREAVEVTVYLARRGERTEERRLSTDGTGEGLADSVHIFVDGEPADRLPSEPGEYEIVLDFSALMAESEWTVAETRASHIMEF